MLMDILSGKALPGEYVFLLLCIAAAWMTGRSVASDWRNPMMLLVWTALLGLAARFLHFALYEAQFVSVSRYLVDLIPIGLVMFAAYRYTRTDQMSRQYYWLYERASPFSWREKRGQPAAK
jgi:hypothetical protein